MKRRAANDLWEALNALRSYLAWALIFTVVAALLSLAPIGYMRDVYGPVLDARSEHTLLMVTFILVGALVLAAFVEWIRARMLAAASVRFAQLLSARVFDATFRANLSGSASARVALSDLRAMRNFMVSPSLVALLDAPMGLIFIVLVFFIHPLMGVMSLLGAIIVFIIGLLAERQVRPLVGDAQRYANAAQAFAASSGRNAQVIEAMGMIGAVRQRWLDLQSRFVRDQAVASEFQSRGAAASKVVMLAQGSLLLGAGVFLSLIGILPPQASAYLIIGKLLGAKAIQPLMQVIQSWKQILATKDSWDRLGEFLDKMPERERRMSLPAPAGHLALDRVAVRAPSSSQTILVDVSFTLKAGRVLALVGPSGSGKSSLARVLIGIWAPVAGSARLDGASVFAWDKSELGHHIGYLPQDVELFDGTIAENIARFGDVDMEQVCRAATLAGLDPILADLPAGLDTDIGDDGCILSGGQRQRVGLARALYGDPRLVVLDEPNSSLDERGEADLVNAIAELKGRGCTVVVITHRRSLLPVVDNILVLAEGRPRLYGPRDKVLAELMGRSAQPASAAPAPAQLVALPPAAGGNAPDASPTAA